MTPQVTKYVIVAVVVGLSLYDLLAVHFGGQEATISRVFYAWACTDPIVAAVAGALVAHLCWPVR